MKLVSLEKKVKSFMTKTGIPSDLVDAVTLPLAPVHQVLKHGDAEWVLQVPGAQEMSKISILGSDGMTQSDCYMSALSE